MAGKRATRLKTIVDVSIYLGRIINQLDRDEITESKAGKLGYLCNILKNVLETGALEKRVEAIENTYRENPEHITYAFEGGLIDEPILTYEQ